MSLHEAPEVYHTWAESHGPRPALRLLVCGNADRGDDGAALTAVARTLPALAPRLRTRLEVRRCEALRVEDLLDVPPETAILILDTVLGPAPGTVVRLPLGELRRPGAPAPHSSHQLPIAQVIALAEVLRGRVLKGSFVGVAGRSFGYGHGASAPVRGALPSLCHAIEAEVSRLVDGEA
jgi:hydrogenase maturation protease